MTKAFNTSQIEAFEMAIQTLIGRVASALRIPLTFDEAADLCIELDHQPILRQATELTKIRQQHNWVSRLHVIGIDGVSRSTQIPFMITRNPEKIPYVVPPYTSTGLASTAPEALVARISAQVERAMQLRQTLGSARIVINELDKLCASPQAARFYFTGLVALADVEADRREGKYKERAKKFANSIRSAKVPAIMPDVPKELAELAKQATKAIAIARLAPQPDSYTSDITLLVNAPTECQLHFGDRRVHLSVQGG
jgi:hypothetical protein